MNSADVELLKISTWLNRHYLLPPVSHFYLSDGVNETTTGINKDTD